MSEITKQRWYAITDLLVKAVSGSALVILGIVGWRLQRDTETARQAVELHDREERRFLPMLQTLSELQLAAQSVVNAMHGLDRSIDIDARLRRDGLALSYLADSLVLADDDRRINVTPARQFASLEPRSQTTLLPIRGLIVMLGQLTQIGPQLRAAHGDCVLVLVADLHVIALRCGTVASHPSSIHYLSHVDSRSEECWKSWLGPEGMDSADLYVDALPGLAAEIGEAAAGAIHDILKEHRDIADKYVQIRTNTLRTTRPQD